MTMGTIKLITAALVVMLLPAAAQAQENLKKAIDNMVSDNGLAEYMKVNSQIEAADNGKNNASYFYQYEFEMPQSKRKTFDAVRTAFNKDIKAAYNVATRHAGISAKQIASIGYGKNLEKTYTLGNYSARNYMIMYVRDSKDEMRRYAYALVWYDSKKKDTFFCSITQVYSLAPQKVREKNSIDSSGVLMGGDFDFAEASKMLVWSGRVDSSTDFLRQFGVLRSTYMEGIKNQEELAYMTKIVNRILTLCKESGYLLNKGERNVCATGLAELTSISTDKYLAALLDEARKQLGGK